MDSGLSMIKNKDIFMKAQQNPTLQSKKTDWFKKLHEPTPIKQKNGLTHD